MPSHIKSFSSFSSFHINVIFIQCFVDFFLPLIWINLAFVDCIEFAIRIRVQYTLFVIQTNTKAMHSLLIWASLLLLLFIFRFARIYTQLCFLVYRIEAVTRINRRPNCCSASLLPSSHDSTLFWYDLILFICHFIGALILIHTYYFVFFFGLLLTNCTRIKRKKHEIRFKKSHTKHLYSYMNWMCTSNIYLLFGAFILLRGAYASFLSTVLHFHARTHFH